MTDQIIPINFRIPKGHRNQEFVLYGKGFACHIAVVGYRKIRFQEGATAGYEPNNHDLNRVLDWMQESVEYLRALCTK